MNWDAIAFDWNQARAFLATAETGSLSAAGRVLHMAQPTVGRQVAALEAALNITLFERIGRSLSLTPAGDDLLRHVRTMADAAANVSLAASGRADTISGSVCVSVTDVFAMYVMPQLVDALRKIAPQIRVEVLVSNDLSDLQRREADIAIRHVAPKPLDLISRKVREAGGRLYASRDYLDRFGAITKVEDVAKADIVGMGIDEELLEFLHLWDLPVSLENIKTTTQHGGLGWQLARQGLGIAPMSDDIAVMFPDMVQVLPDLTPIPVPYWLTTHRELHNSKRIRLVYDHLAQALSQRDLPLPRVLG